MPLALPLAIVGGTVASALIGARASEKAADAQAAAQNQARADFLPFRDTGASAMYSLADLYGLSRTGGGPTGTPFGPSALEAFRQSPDYAFPLAEGTRSLLKIRSCLLREFRQVVFRRGKKHPRLSE